MYEELLKATHTFKVKYPVMIVILKIRNLHQNLSYIFNTCLNFFDRS